MDSEVPIMVPRFLPRGCGVPIRAGFPSQHCGFPTQACGIPDPKLAGAPTSNLLGPQQDGAPGHSNRSADAAGFKDHGTVEANAFAPKKSPADRSVQRPAGGQEAEVLHS